MWRMGLVVLVLAAVGSRASADDIYRWTDKAGHVHISNAPTVGDRKTAVEAESMPTAPAAADPRSGAAAPDEEHAAFSSGVSLRRTALERDLRATENRMKQIDAQLGTLSRARTQFARGTIGTGGVGSNAIDFRSPEELTLADERDKLSKHAAETRASGEALREEVMQRLGTTPEWWRDLR